MLLYIRHALITTIFIVVSIQQGTSIKCYVCNSNMNSSCGEIINTTAISATDCNSYNRPTQEYSYDIFCQKIKIEDAEGHNNITFMRGCSVQIPGYDACDDIESTIGRLTDGAAVVTSCVTCAHDLCNI
ncbi:hypothetical protein L9F63_013056 [Diploptera punctata]|uniref:Protein sleepless n=1 Tax=Diploptera punctata TaxID=6984 RepID=A0AAD8EN74_DIPPU|nr:hypothetical protein L9F63_013056 [Diploptera punctata]